MYNEDRKTRFIREYTSSTHTASVARNIFNAFESHEAAWGDDLCTRSSEELQPVVEELTGVRARSKFMPMIILREYVKWCMFMQVPGACDGMLQVQILGLDKIRRQMVSGPVHLQRFLDDIMDPESEQTICNIYRCYYWLAYGGVDENDIVLIRNEQVDFESLTIHYKDTSVPIYREALPAFRNAVTLTDFQYKHPNYSETIRRNRVPGDAILRGIKAQITPFAFRATLNRRNVKALEDGVTTMRLSFNRVRLSGLFYRVYEQERAGAEPNFMDAVRRDMEGKEYSLPGRATLNAVRNKKVQDYLEDYERWKLAFSSGQTGSRKQYRI